MTGDTCHIKEKESAGIKKALKKRKNRGFCNRMQAKGAKRFKI
jgi:hypothetical protein